MWLGGGCHAPPCGPGMTLWGEEGEGAGEGACLPIDSGEAFTTCTQQRAGVLMEEVSESELRAQNVHWRLCPIFAERVLLFHRTQKKSNISAVCRLV